MGSWEQQMQNKWLELKSLLYNQKLLIIYGVACQIKIAFQVAMQIAMQCNHPLQKCNLCIIAICNMGEAGGKTGEKREPRRFTIRSQINTAKV